MFSPKTPTTVLQSITQRLPTPCTFAALILAVITSRTSKCAEVTVVNSGFEDITGEVPFNEFTFGPFPGWDVYDPLGIAGSGNGPSIFLGTLTPNAPTFFDLGAPEGQRVGIAFGFFGSGGSGEYGLQQTLTETLQSHRRYELEVEIGNIASGTAVNNDFFNLDGFPGYRVDLMAGDSVIGQDLNTLAGSIPEGAFATSRISFTSGATHEAMGQELSIRLVNLNEVDPLFPNADLEVDFDNVRLTAVSVPEPSSLMFLIAIGSWMTLRRRDRSDRS